MKKKIVVFAAVCVLGITTLTGCNTTEEADGQGATVTTASEVAQMDDPDAVTNLNVFALCHMLLVSVFTFP